MRLRGLSSIPVLCWAYGMMTYQSDDRVYEEGSRTGQYLVCYTLDYCLYAWLGSSIWASGVVGQLINY